MKQSVNPCGPACDSSTSVNEYTTTSEPSVGTTTDSFTTYSEEEIKEYVAEKVNVEVSAVETQTVEKEVTAEKIHSRLYLHQKVTVLQV